jgi:ribosomal protein S18 acetylase RimI-like enzyme
VLPVRDATRDDVPAIARLMRAVADEGRWISTLPGTPVARLEERFAALLRADGHHRLVLDDGAGGVAGLCTIERTGERTPHALGMSLAAGARGRGHGGRLLDAALERAAADPDVAKVTLEAWPHNAAAIGLYASRGFVVEGVLRDHYAATVGPGRWSSVIMGWWPGATGPAGPPR